MAKVALKFLPPATLRSKKSFSSCDRQFTAQYLKLSKGNSAWLCGFAGVEPRVPIEDCDVVESPREVEWARISAASQFEAEKYVKRSLANTVTDMEELMRGFMILIAKAQFIVRGF